MHDHGFTRSGTWSRQHGQANQVAGHEFAHCVAQLDVVDALALTHAFNILDLHRTPHGGSFEVNTYERWRGSTS